MTLRTIHLNATESDWRLFTIRASDEKFKKFRDRIFKRDHHTCQYCGFQATQFLDVINADGDYGNNHMSNLVTACQLCAQCFFLEGVGKSEFGGGTLIYLPEMPQNDLNAFCHVLFSMIVSGGRSSADAKTIYRNLRLRTQYVEKELGKGMSSPSIYGQLLIDANIKDKKKLHDELMTKLRILPTMPRYVSQIEAWTLDALNDMS
ncbi:MAG: HNH endonuclease [Coxiella sp. (in: Bacteria)]|nr:MAG: HNH endonuclease [Coxiella sp. (in: g-proteobacteria)]